MQNEVDQLNPLLNIRKQREFRCRRELAHAKERYQQRLQDLHDAKQAVQSFIQYRLREEENQFNQLAGREQQTKSLHYYRHNVEVMKEQQLQLQQHITRCEEAVHSAANDVTEAKNALLAAAREVEKFSELVKEAVDRALREAEIREDAELDEISLSTWATRHHG